MQSPPDSSLREQLESLAKLFNRVSSSEALKPAVLALAVCCLSQAEQPLSPSKTYHFASAIGALDAGWLKLSVQHLEKTLQSEDSADGNGQMQWRAAVEGVTYEDLKGALQYLTRVNGH